MKKFAPLILMASAMAYGQTNTFPSSGNVGIGTTTPGSNLVVNGTGTIGVDIATNGTSTSRPVLSFSRGSGFWNIGMNMDVGNTDNFHFRYNGTSFPLTIQATSGYVGIGTTAPGARLDVYESGGESGQLSALRIRNGNSQNYFGNNQVVFSYAGGTGYSHSIKTRHNSGALSGNALDFYLWKPGDAVDAIGSNLAMTLDGGNLGIGTATPYSWSRMHIKAPGPNPWGIIAEANGNDKVVALGHDGMSGVIAVSYLGAGGWSPLEFRTQNVSRMNIAVDGNVGIGTTTPDAKLAVKGQIHAQEVKVDLIGAVAPDYVFEKDYNLPSLESIQSYIDQHKHLPEIPSAKEMEANGVKLGEMNMLLLKKIEELTLYMIELKNENVQLREAVKKINSKIK